MFVIVRYRYVRSHYMYFYIACVACCVLHVQLVVFRSILLSGDIESNPGPEALNFCTSCKSLTEAYNSVYNYDLIGIAEARLNNTVVENRLAIDRYIFI